MTIFNKNAYSVNIKPFDGLDGINDLKDSLAGLKLSLNEETGIPVSSDIKYEPSQATMYEATPLLNGATSIVATIATAGTLTIPVKKDMSILYQVASKIVEYTKNIKARRESGFADVGFDITVRNNKTNELEFDGKGCYIQNMSFSNTNDAEISFLVENGTVFQYTTPQNIQKRMFKTYGGF